MQDKTNIDERRVQVLEVLTEKIQRLDKTIEELRKESSKESEKIEQIRITLASMQGADFIEQVRENRRTIEKQEERIRKLEDFTNNLIGKLVILAFVATLLATMISTVVVKSMTAHTP